MVLEPTHINNYRSARVSKLKWYKDRGFQFVTAEYNNNDIDELINNIDHATVEMYIDFRDSDLTRKMLG